MSAWRNSGGGVVATSRESTTSTNAKTRCGAGWWLLVVVLLGRKKVDLYSVNVLQRRHYEDIAVDVVLKAAKKCLRQRLGTQRWYKSIGFSTETSCARTAQSEDTHQESTTSTNAKTRCGARWWLLVVLLLGGMWYMVYGTWYMVSSMVYGTWYVVYGMVYGIWYGIWYMVHCMNSSARRQQ